MANFKFGRKQPKGAPALAFASVAEALVIPDHPAQYNSTGWSGWDILGNDKYGDCVAVTWATVRRIVTTWAGQPSYPSLSQVLKFYRTQNPNFDPAGSSSTNGPGSSADGGMDIQTALEYLLHNGGPDGVKALAFAKVDHRNVDEMKAAIALFDYLWLGVNVTDVNEQEFPNTPWTPEGNILGGHSITGTGYDPSKFDMETWACESFLSTDFITKGSASGAGVEEAWIVIWPEHATRLTVDQRTALDTAFFDLTGRHIDWPTPAPTPTPTPTPTPVPTPTPADPQAVFVAAAKEWLSHRHTSHQNVAMVEATKAYLTSLGE